MEFKLLFIIVIAIGAGYITICEAQLRNTVLETTKSCYQNITALNRANRQPMHISNLISIIRKIEEKAFKQWDMRRVARTIIKRFQFDGIYHDPQKSQELEYSAHPNEGIKTQIIHDLIPANADVIPNDFLDNDERCALHWMLSHSLNATMRDDEDLEKYSKQKQRQRYTMPDGGLRAKRAVLATDTRTTNRPIETGTVYTDWGPVSAGRVIAGIAAALEEQSIPITFKSENRGLVPDFSSGSGSGGYPNNPNPESGYRNPNSGYRPSRQKRQSGTIFQNLKNVHAATLAGDIGQAAILNAPFYKIIGGLSPPVGNWNDTICPREYILNALPDPTADPSHEHDTWSSMTGAEIRGGMDGLILGQRAKTLSNQGFTLSDILEMYYSEEGIYGESNFKSCERISLYSGSVNQAELKEQSRSFAYLYNSKSPQVSVTDETIQIFNDLVEKAYSKMANFQSTISSDPPCKNRRNPGSGFETPDIEKETKTTSTVYALLDHTTNYDDFVAQQRFAAKLAYELRVSPQGSRLGLVDGRTGQILISSNYTDNAPILACRIINQNQILQGTSNIAQVIRTLKNELVRMKNLQQSTDDRLGTNYATQRITLLIFVQGKKLEESQKNNILDAFRELNNELGNIQIMFTSSKYTKQDLVNFMINTDDSNFIQLRNPVGGNLTDNIAEFTKGFLEKSHGSLPYPKCNAFKYTDQSKELLEYADTFIRPNTIKYFVISPEFFFTSVDLRLRFTSDNGKARICVSRDYKFPIYTNEREMDDRNIECRETSGTYAEPTYGKKDVEFTYTKPCKSKKLSGCSPIYISITPTTVPVASGGIGPDCSSFGCQFPDEVKVTHTHYGMRCNGAGGIYAASSLGLLSAILSIFYLFRNL